MSNDNPIEDHNKDTVAGRVKQAAGDLTGNDDLEQEGEEQEAVGEAKSFVDKAADKVADTVDKAADKVNETIDKARDKNT